MGRPTEHLTVYLKDGTPITCTIKTPKINLVAKVNALCVRSKFIREERQAALKLSEATNRLVASSEMALAAATFDAKDSDDPVFQQRVADAQKQYADATKARDLLFDQISAKEEADTDTLIERTKLICNIPNDGDRVRSNDEIDWEATDLEEMTEAVVFFLNGKKS